MGRKGKIEERNFPLRGNDSEMRFWVDSKQDLESLKKLAELQEWSVSDKSGDSGESEDPGSDDQDMSVFAHFLDGYLTLYQEGVHGYSFHNYWGRETTLKEFIQMNSPQNSFRRFFGRLVN
jgi:hypothetical protein